LRKLFDILIGNNKKANKNSTLCIEATF